MKRSVLLITYGWPMGAVLRTADRSIRRSQLLSLMMFVVLIPLFAAPAGAEEAKKNGVHKEYLSEYQSDLECEYKNGKKNGWCKGQNANGRIEVYFENDEALLSKSYSPQGKLLSESERRGDETYVKGYYVQQNAGVRWEHMYLKGETLIPSSVKTFYENGQLESERTYDIVGRYGSIVSQKQYDGRGNLICERGGLCDMEQLKKNKDFDVGGCERKCTQMADELLCRCYTIEGKLKVESSLKNGVEIYKEFDLHDGHVTLTREYKDGKVTSENGIKRP